MNRIQTALNESPLSTWRRVSKAYKAYVEAPKQFTATPQRERGIALSGVESVTGIGIQNPHDLFAVGGIEIVKNMMTDDAFGSFIDFTKTAALSVDLTMQPGVADDEASQQVADNAWGAIQNIKGSLTDALHEMFSSLEYGFSVTNKVFEPIEGGQFDGLIGLKYLKTKDPEFIEFDVDVFKNIKPNGIISSGGDFTQEALPRDEFIVYTYRPRFGDPYGYPVSIRAYLPWNSKRQLHKFWLIWMERHATGTFVAQYDPDNLPGDDEFTAVKSFMDRKQALSSLRVSKLWEFDFHEVSGDAGDVHEQAIAHQNKAIARCVFMPDQLGFGDSSAGSNAKAKTQMNMMLFPIERMHRDMEEVLSEQLTKGIVDANDGPQEAYPRLKFGSLTDEQKVQLMTGISTAIKDGAITKDLEVENKMRELLELAALEELEEETAGGGPLGGEPKEEPKGEPTGDAIDDDDEFAAIAASVTDCRTRVPELATGGIIHNTGPINLSCNCHAGKNIPNFLEHKPARELTTYEQKVDIDAFFGFIEATEEGFVDTWADLMAVNMNKILKDVRRKNIVNESDLKAINELRMIARGDMAKALERFMLSTYYFGALQGQEELRRAKARTFSFEKFDVAAFQAVDFTKMPPSEIEKFFIERGLNVTATIRTAAREIRARSFFVTDVNNEQVLSKVKQVLYRGIERQDQAWAEAQIRKVFNGYLKTGEITEGALTSAWRIETIARNNFTTAVNQGRRASWEDPDVVDFVKAYQWSAVLDDSTTVYCSTMDQRVLKKEELNQEGWPPADHNCRSIVVPVVEGEEFKFSKIPKSINRANGFEMAA